MCQQASVHVEPRTAATRHPAGRQTPRHPRLLRGRPPLLPAGFLLLAGTILKMGKNARFGTPRTNAFMWSRALLLRETHPVGRPRAARAPSAVARPPAGLLNSAVWHCTKTRVFQYECASKQACTWSREPLPRDTQPAGRPRATRAPSAIARTCAVQDSCCCLEPY